MLLAPVFYREISEIHVLVGYRLKMNFPNDLSCYSWSILKEDLLMVINFPKKVIVSYTKKIKLIQKCS